MIGVGMRNSICIIGAGLAGGIIASELSRAGYSVTLIDQGDVPTPYDNHDETWLPNTPKASFTRGTGRGGTSNYWHGGLTILDRSDVEDRSDIFSTHKMPIEYSELLDYYDRALSRIDTPKTLKLADINTGPAKEGNDFELNADEFKYKGLLYPNTVYCTKDEIRHAEIEYGLNVITDYLITHFNFTSDNKVCSVGGTRNGQLETYSADMFILCAGGLGSPKVLLNSSVNNEKLLNLPVGKYLTDHPSGFVFKAKLRKRMNLKNLFGQQENGYRLQHGFTLNSHKLDIANNRNHIVYLRPAISMKDPLIYDFLKRKLVGYKGKHLSLSDIAYLFRHSDLLYEAVNFKFGLFNTTRYVSGLTFIEQSPGDGHQICADGTDRYKVHWSVTKNDDASALAFLKHYFDCHKHMFEHYEIFPNINRRLETSGHHSGGCRMSVDPTTGVVDNSLRVFGIDNLFVADGSVLGYTGYANTGLSIMALALRCVDNVKSYL